MYYKIRETLQAFESQETVKEKNIIITCSSKEWEENKSKLGLESSLIKDINHIRFSKVDVYHDFMEGAFLIPPKQNENALKFAFVIKEALIVFIENTGAIDKILEKITASKKWKEPSIERFLYSFLETIIDEDLIYLEKTENKIAALEIKSLKGDLDGFNERMINIRKELMALQNCYEQLIGIGAEFIENENGFFDESNLRYFKLFTDKAERLKNNAQMLREYSMQVMETHQAQVDIQLNNVMKVLTIVTTVFLPLTLIVGWYGMNFKNMPEIYWHWGYYAVMALCVVVVIVCLLIFKKKKML